METKKCNGCLKVLPVSEFGKESRAKNGYKPRCKECSNEYYRNFYATNDYKKKKREQVKEYYHDNKERYSAKRKKYYEENKNDLLQYAKEYKVKNKEKINKINREYISNKRKSNDQFACLLFMRKQIHRCLNSKTDRTHKLLGYTKHQLLKHLGGSIPKGYTIDHKIPLSWFKSSAPVYIVNHLENLQLLESSLNFQKNNTYADTVSKSYYDICINHIKTKKQKEVTHENPLA